MVGSANVSQELQHKQFPCHKGCNKIIGVAHGWGHSLRHAHVQQFVAAPCCLQCPRSWLGLEVICTKCPPGWQHFEKNCYLFSTSTKSWLDAKQFCTNEGSHLVIVNTKQEQTFLSNQLIEPDLYWLGLSDSAKEGEWRWVDGSLLSVRFWGPGEPNNVGQHGEDCVHLRFNGKWNDAICSRTEHWICERRC
uniref:C-type lectin domain-containing protein n=1 Tax=Chrysemys picta bellii TaxID=8478 RepID=A0A8C3FHG7_CHRPI